MLKLALIANHTDSLEGFFDFFIENKNKIEKKAAQKFEITYIFNDSPENEVKAFLAARDVDLKVTDNYQQLVKNKEVDIIIELSRKFETADYLLQALKNKKQVITSNHKVLAENYLLIKEAEKKFRTRVFFSAVFSPLPLKTLLNNFYSLDEVKEINGVLNATTNFILAEMEKNTVSMKETVEQAKELSYTEENPEFDLSGRDSLNKSILLADLIYNTALDPSQVQAKGIKGITSYDLIYAAELGYKIKLISTIKKQDEKIYFGVRPNLVPENSFFSSLNDNSNGIELFSNYNSRTFIKAENNESAASNLFSQDLISAAEIISSQNDINFDLEALRANKIKLDDLYQQQANNFYVRLQLEKDKQIIEKIKDIFSEKNLADLILHDNLTETPLLPVIIITKKIKEKDLEELLKEVENLEGVLTVNNVIAVKTE